MNNSFRTISLNHKNASVDIRGMLALDNQECKNVLENIKNLTSIAEAIVVSTCNRTEIYYSHDEELGDQLIKIIGISKGLTEVIKFKKHFEIINDHNQALNHLFNVSMGLDAQVVGDIQISNQIKNAYQLCVDSEMAGPFLHRLMHTVFFTNKKIIQETAFRDGAASVSYATVELAEELAATFINPKVLVIGLGEMGTDVARNLKSSSITNVWLANRTESKAIDLAEELELNYTSFTDISKTFKKYDLIISGLSVKEPFINNTNFGKEDVGALKYLIDLGIPKTIDSTLEQIPGVALYNVDQIKTKTSETLQKRIDSIPDVRLIIKEAIEDFGKWSKEMEVSPTIQKLKSALESIRQEEIDRYTKSISHNDAEIIDKVTKGIMQKIIKLPVLQLKAACKRGEAETLVDVLNELFDLEASPKEA